MHLVVCVKFSLVIFSCALTLQKIPGCDMVFRPKKATQRWQMRMNVQSVGQEDFSVLEINATLLSKDKPQIPQMFYSSAAKCLESAFAGVQAKPE